MTTLTDDQFDRLLKKRDPLQLDARAVGVIITLLLMFGGWMARSSMKQTDAIAAFSDRMLVMETKFDAATQDRFYRHEGEAMEARLGSRLDLLSARVELLEGGKGR